MNIRLIYLSLVLNLSEFLILGAGFILGFFESIAAADSLCKTVLAIGLIQIILLVVSLFRQERTSDNKVLSLLSIVISSIIVLAALGFSSMF